MATQQQQPSAATQQPQTASSYLDLGVTLAINAWPALTLAVTSSWGGPTSSDKRDWLCGAISEMLVDRPETDAEDLEDVLIQVMNDEFDVVVDDESAGEVAERIMEVRKAVEKGEFEAVRQMWAEWEAKRGQRGSAVAGFRRGEDVEQETDEDESDDDEGDVDMGEAPALVRAPRERVEPEVDEDGFTKVVGKKKR
ncbi:Putative Pre-rRNA processing protein [Aspergillus calidoustus]|uniref:Putative Pre-rRNA processing protein n=1 Tax=Aspergillus calidoustus TaxID=454130 RepID=A0A0U5G0H5_ASPCI|nr:Putative Pre-rRNA processing protein [Aspergillus calidoustus]